MQMAIGEARHHQPVAAVDDGVGLDRLEMRPNRLDAIAHDVDIALERLAAVRAAHRKDRRAADQDRHGFSSRAFAPWETSKGSANSCARLRKAWMPSRRTV